MKKPSSDIVRYWQNWQEEVDSAAEYHAMAESERDPRLASIFRNLAKTEEKHAAFWEGRISQAGQNLRPRRPSLRSRVLSSIARHLGARAVLSSVAAKERAGQGSYDNQPETKGTQMRAQERWHARVLEAALNAAPTAGMDGRVVGSLESRHRAVGGNVLRAAVLGANDGLCSNLSLVMGVSGAAVNTHGVLVTGLAGLLAGAFSMALGEWVSVTSSRELAQREIAVESEELELDPESEGDELQLIYEAKGMAPEQAKAFIKEVLADKKVALDTLTREELGIDPNGLGGSAWEAALFSFLLFSIGAILPVVPFIFKVGGNAVWFSLGVGAVSLFLAGAAISLFTGRPVLWTGLRQLFLGLLAAGTTFLLGRLVATFV